MTSHDRQSMTSKLGNTSNPSQIKSTWFCMKNLRRIRLKNPALHHVLVSSQMAAVTTHMQRDAQWNADDVLTCVDSDTILHPNASSKQFSDLSGIYRFVFVQRRSKSLHCLGHRTRRQPVIALFQHLHSDSDLMKSWCVIKGAKSWLIWKSPPYSILCIKGSTVTNIKTYKLSKYICIHLNYSKSIYFVDSAQLMVAVHQPKLCRRFHPNFLNSGTTLATWLPGKRTVSFLMSFCHG